MIVAFEAEVIFWHGPAPFVFAVMPLDESKTIKTLSNVLSYGWGCIPVKAKIGKTEWSTSLMPKDGKYLVPIKMVVQKAEKIEVGKAIRVILEFRE